MKKKNILIYFVIIAFIGVAAYYVYNKEIKMSEKSVQNIDGQKEDPFANLVILEGADEATKAVMQIKIDNTKAMYEEKPDIWETWISIGNLKVLLEDYKGAIKAYRESISLQSNNILGYRNIAEVYKNNLHDYDSAIEYYKLAIEINQADAELYIARALLQEFQTKDLRGAEETYINGLRYTNNNFEILNRALTFYERNDNPEKKKEVQNKINELYPDSAAAQ